MLEHFRQASIGVKIALVLVWLLYIPFAVILFMFSTMMSDSPATTSLQLWIGGLLIDGTPFAIMLGMSYLALRRNSVLIALSPPAIFIAIWYFLATVQFYQITYEYSDSPYYHEPHCTGYDLQYRTLRNGTEKRICFGGRIEYIQKNERNAN